MEGDKFGSTKEGKSRNEKMFSTFEGANSGKNYSIT